MKSRIDVTHLGSKHLPADLHVGLPHDVLLSVHLVGLQGGVLDPKCGTYLTVIFRGIFYIGQFRLDQIELPFPPDFRSTVMEFWAKIKNVFFSESETEMSSSSRELKLLRMRVLSLERENEKKQERNQQLEHMLKECEKLKTKKQKKSDTPTRLLYEWSTKNGVYCDFKFLEPHNFEFKNSMKMWDKKELLGNYQVQLNVAGSKFFGNAELPQQAKHYAALQALEILYAGTEEIGTKETGTEATGTTTSVAATKTMASCGSGQGKNVNMALNEFAMRNRLKPKWTLSESGPQHQKRFTWQLTLGNFTSCGTGHSKKIAK